jgi:hypothetical protein
MRSPVRLLAALVLTATLAASGTPTAAAPSPTAAGQRTVVTTHAGTVTSEEAALDGSVVERLYLAYFRRPAEPAGLAYWVGVWQDGYPIDSISNEFSRADEFRARYGNVDNRRFVDLVYRNVMDRSPDNGGYDYWLAHIAKGLTRGQLMIQFSESAEFKAKTRKPASAPRNEAEPAPQPQPETAPQPEPAPVTADRYALIERNGQPVGWKPCTTIPVTANRAGAPAGADFDAALGSALEKLTAATGITWQLTSGAPARPADHTNPPFVAGGVTVTYATGWADGNGAVGYGALQYSWTGETERAHITKGAVVLRPGATSWTTAMVETLLLHELGHVAGLGHVDHRDEVMYPTMNGLTDYGSGDRYGLGVASQLGTAC